MTEFEKSCCFSGHRKIDAAKLGIVIKKLNLEIEWMIAHGITDFYAGGALGFDTIAALEVLLYKKHGCPVRLHLVLPCFDQTKLWKMQDVAIYKDILEKADTVTVISDTYDRGVMFKRNRTMVENCKYCLCYFEDSNKDGPKKNKGGTRFTVKYAKKLCRNIINLNDEPLESYPIEFAITE